MSEQLIDLLKLGLLALLYLFFLRVIWAVWTELRAPAVEPVGAAGAPAVAPKRQRATRTRQARGELTTLRVLEPAEMAAERAAADEHVEVLRSTSDDKLATDAEGALNQRAAQEAPSIDMAAVKAALDEMERLSRINEAVEGCRRG